jgi:hypothetical protein
MITHMASCSPSALGKPTTKNPLLFDPISTLALREVEVAQLTFSVRILQVDTKDIVQHTQLRYASCHTTKTSFSDLDTSCCC